MAQKVEKSPGRGARTDLACPRCSGQTTSLMRRASAEDDEAPGFPPIGRTCRECSWEEITARFPKKRCTGEHRMRRAYKRGPRPAQLRLEAGHVCVLCGHRET